MPTERAKLTSKSQLVLPKGVREFLAAGPGDVIAFEYGPNGVRVEKVVADDPFATFSEWASDADDEAYKDL